MSRWCPSPRLPLAWLTVIAALWAASALAGALDEMSLERWAKLREAERYQLNIAEKYYREQNWKVALAEYEKFLTLYEESEGAPYAQLKWSLCLVELRKVNTAIKDGFQSVIDYWPDSPEAVSSGYLIGRCYKSMGEIAAAKKAFAEVMTKHPQHLVATLARVELADIARVENDTPRRVQLWKELVFDTDRKDPEAARHCADAARALAAHAFSSGSFAEGLKALATTYDAAQLPAQVVQYVRGPLQTLASQTETKAQAERLADDVVAWLGQQPPGEGSEEVVRVRAIERGFFIADIQAAAGRADEVPKVYDAMLQKFGSDDAILGRLAGWYKSQNRRDEARGVYARYTNKVEGQNQIAYSYREERKYDLALPIYQRLVGEDSQRTVLWRSTMALTYREAGKPDEALAIYQQLLTDDPQQAGQWQWQMAVTYRDFGRLKEAIAAFRLCDNFPESYQQMAWCHRQLKEYKEAIVLYQQVLGGHEPSAPWALLQIAFTQEEAGETESAIKSLQQVCRRFPKSGQASEAHARLQDKYKINATLGGATSE